MERKTIFNFVSQGAAGGLAGYFFLYAFAAGYFPNGYAVLYLVFLPVNLVFGSLFGAVIGAFVWLPGVLLKRRLGFVTRVGITTATVMLLSFAVSYLIQERRGEEDWNLLWAIGFYFVMSLPVALMTGSRIRPFSLLALGAGRRAVRHNLGSWLAIPAGFLLRTASIFVLLEALMTLAIWISSRRLQWDSFPAREYLPGIILAIIYFAASAYLSFRSPRKLFLLPIAILLNLPLAASIVYVRRIGTAEANALAYLMLGFIGMWAIYTLGRLIAHESVPNNVTYSHETAVSHKALAGVVFQVQP